MSERYVWKTRLTRATVLALAAAAVIKVGLEPTREAVSYVRHSLGSDWDNVLEQGLDNDQRIGRAAEIGSAAIQCGASVVRVNQSTVASGATEVIIPSSDNTLTDKKTVEDCIYTLSGDGVTLRQVTPRSEQPEQLTDIGVWVAGVLKYEQ